MSREQKRDRFMLKGKLARNGYDWWWHNFTGYSRSTGEKRAFFIEYYICNPELGEEEAVLGQLPENQQSGKRPSYAMLKVGTWGENPRQIHNFYPIHEFAYSNHPFAVSIGENFLSEEHMVGSCSITPKEAKEHPEYLSDAGSITWDLDISKKLAFNVGYGASWLFRSLNAFEMFWHAQGMKTEYQGVVTLDDEIYDVAYETSYGYADKNWGADYTSPWLWIGSSHLKSMITGEDLPDSAVEFGGGRPKVFSHPLDRKLLGCIYYKGKKYEYNFSKFLSGSKVSFQFEEGKDVHSWQLVARNRHSLLQLKLSCPVSEMLLIRYEAPNGSMRHNRLWNGGTGYGEMKLYKTRGRKKYLVDHIQFDHTGCEYGEYTD